MLVVELVLLGIAFNCVVKWADGRVSRRVATDSWIKLTLLLRFYYGATSQRVGSMFPAAQLHASQVGGGLA